MEEIQEEDGTEWHASSQTIVIWAVGIAGYGFHSRYTHSLQLAAPGFLLLGGLGHCTSNY